MMRCLFPTPLLGDLLDSIGTLTALNALNHGINYEPYMINLAFLGVLWVTLMSYLVKRIKIAPPRILSILFATLGMLFMIAASLIFL